MRQLFQNLISNALKFQQNGDKPEVVVEGRYTTKAVHQGYIEPHACVASMSADGQGYVWRSSQGHFMVRTYCAKVLGLEASNIRVTPAEIGGGFGDLQTAGDIEVDVGLVQSHACSGFQHCQ